MHSDRTSPATIVRAACAASAALDRRWVHDGESICPRSPGRPVLVSQSLWRRRRISWLVMVARDGESASTCGTALRTLNHTKASRGDHRRGHVVRR